MDENHLEKSNGKDIDSSNEQAQVVLSAVDISAPASPSILAQSQLCSSCRFERAAVICTVCNETSTVDNFASNDQIAKNNDDNKNIDVNEDVYFQKSASRALDEENDHEKIDLDQLMRSNQLNLYTYFYSKQKEISFY